MRTQNTKHTKKPMMIIIAILAILLLSSSYVFAAHQNNFWPFSAINEPSTSPNTLDASQKNKADIINGTPSDKTTDQIPVNDTFVATFTDLRQENGEVIFSGAVNSTDTKGTCSVTFTNPNDKPVTRTVDARIVDNSTICGPILIPEVEFSYIGDWVATFRYFINDSQVVTSRNITIK